LTAAAMATSRVRLGTSVLVLGYLNPFVTAKQLATIDWLSHGRVDVGVGVGALRPEFDAIKAVPFDRRGVYADESIDVMKLLWSPGPSSFHGEFFSFDGVEAYPGPYEPGGLPVLIGGNTPAALRRVAVRGDGWHGIGATPDEMASLRERLGTVLAEHERSIEGFPVQVRLHIDADDLDADAWRERARAYTAAGVTELVLAPQTREGSEQRRWLETIVPGLIAATSG
jgi:probable F420-dependent oxidoreductase